VTVSTNKPIIPVRIGKVGSQGSVTVKAAFAGGLCSKVYCEETNNDNIENRD
jgi:hypothetical protein